MSRPRAGPPRPLPGPRMPPGPPGDSVCLSWSVRGVVPPVDFRVPCALALNPGIYQTTLPTGLISPSEIVNRMANEIAYRFGLYRPTSVPVGGILSPRHIDNARGRSFGC